MDKTPARCENSPLRRRNTSVAAGILTRGSFRKDLNPGGAPSNGAPSGLQAHV